mgnify:CR=1 FL=1
MREKIENFIAMSGATLLIAVGTYFFKFPNNFTFGGITGLAVLIAKTGLISAADFSFVANMSLLILGAVILGKKFVLTEVIDYARKHNPVIAAVAACYLRAVYKV